MTYRQIVKRNFELFCQNPSFRYVSQNQSSLNPPISKQVKATYSHLPNKYAIAYIYTFKKMIEYKDLENKLIESLSRLQTELSKGNEV